MASLCLSGTLRQIYGASSPKSIVEEKAWPISMELTSPLRRPSGSGGLCRALGAGTCSDNVEIERLRKQAIALSQFGGHALRTQILDSLLQEASELVSEATGVELVKVLEFLPDRDTMLVRAGVNWGPGVVGQATFGAHRDSPAGTHFRKTVR